MNKYYISIPLMRLQQNLNTQSTEFFSFTVNSGSDSSFILPTAHVSGQNTTYNWKVDWGDGTITNEEGTGSFVNDTGISHTYPNANTNYQITISPQVEEYGWSKCFGFSQDGAITSGVQTNRDKLISLDTPFTLKMTCQNDEGLAILQFGAAMFENCTKLSDISSCYLPEGIINANDSFCARMFTNCKSLTTLGNFTLPQSITETLGGFCTCMFMDCTSLTNLGSFNLPQNMVGDAKYMFLYAMFERDTALTTLNNLQIPQGITKVGDQSFYGMFADCTSLSNIGNLSIPRGITQVGTEFCSGMFLRTKALTSLPETFKMPLNISKIVGNDFVSMMFQESGITTLPSDFAINVSESSIGDNFMYQMFALSNITSIPSTFTLPSNITVAGNNCFRGIFAYCTKLTSLNNMSIPQNIVTVGDYFLAYFNRENTTIQTLPSGFKLPGSIVEVGKSFCQMSFHACSALTSGAINFMSLSNLNKANLDKDGVFNGTFANCSSLNETLNTSTIPQLNISPTEANLCFYNIPSSCTTNCPYYWYSNILTGYCLDKNDGLVDLFVLNYPAQVEERTLLESNGALVYANSEDGPLVVTQTNRNGSATKYWLGSNNTLTYPVQYVSEYVVKCLPNGTIIQRTENPWKGFEYHMNTTALGGCHAYHLSYAYNFVAGKKYKIELCNIVLNAQSYVFNLVLQNVTSVTTNVTSNELTFAFPDALQYIVQNSSISVSPQEYETSYTITASKNASYLVLASASPSNNIQGFAGTRVKITVQ